MAPGGITNLTQPTYYNDTNTIWVSTSNNNFISKVDTDRIEEMYKQAQRQEKIDMEKKDHDVKQFQCHLKSKQTVSRLPVKYKKPHMNRRIIS